MRIGIESGAFWFTIGGLFVFGCLYACLIYWMRNRNYLEPYTAYMVVFGVVVTLIGNKYIHHLNPLIDFLLELASFAASGLPMIVGSMFTHLWAIERDSLVETEQLSKMNGGGNATS